MSTQSGNNLAPALNDNSNPAPATLVDVPEEEADGKGKGNESMKVQYRDPEQTAVQNKLMKLLTGSSPEPREVVVVPSKDRRRNKGKTRTPGF